jgi:hypothetical protein
MKNLIYLLLLSKFSFDTLAPQLKKTKLSTSPSSLLVLLARRPKPEAQPVALA